MFLCIYTYMCACIHDTYVKKVDSRDNLGTKRMEGIMKGEEDLGIVIWNLIWTKQKEISVWKFIFKLTILLLKQLTKKIKLKFTSIRKLL